ncbi:MAG: HAMP domain-containing histidine kinase [Calothrix sp. FI2-JRJ7]|jgi:signal transduction histidine kinase|nr:HAMP domain-containing histidine kinase [Calothrix sp. FI2-JRJ7]
MTDNIVKLLTLLSCEKRLILVFEGFGGISLKDYKNSQTWQWSITDIQALSEGINSTLLILGHRLKADSTRPAIQIIKDYGDLSLVDYYPGALNQVFMNLVANAIDAMEEGNIGKTYQEIELNPNTITIRTYVGNDMVVVRIKDNGLGMNQETRASLFNAFFTTKPSGKGTGLGLSISYKIITEQHGGKLDVITAPLTGAEFVIQIPLQ